MPFDRFFIFILVAHRCDSFGHVKSVGGNTETEPEVWETENGRRFPEFHEIAKFLEPATKVVKTENCRKQMRFFLESLSNSSLWAVQMLDACGKVPQGLLSSDAYDLGNYDECLEIDLKRNENDDFLFGKYCLANISTSPECKNEIRNRFRKSEVSTFENLIVPVLGRGFANNNFRSGLCVPHECTSSDVEIMLRFLYSNVAKINCRMNIRIDENACTTAKTGNGAVSAFSASRIILSSFLGVGIVTVLDLWTVSCNLKLPGFATRFIMPFSAYGNYNRLVSSHASERIIALDSLKVFAIIFLTINRRLNMFLLGPILNREFVDQIFSRWFEVRFFEIADELNFGTLLVASGFLHFRKAYDFATKANSHVKIRRFYMVQILKVLPLYFAAVFFYAFAYEHYGDGPLWKERAKNSVDKCKENFAGHFLHFENFANLNESCIFESRYFASVALYFSILPFVVQITAKSSTAGLTFLGLLTGSAFLMPLRLTIHESDSAKPDFSVVNWKRGWKGTNANEAFFYFMGMTSSLICIEFGKERNRKVSEIKGHQGKIMAGIFAGGLLIFPPFNPTQFELFRESIKLIWSLIVSFLIILVSTRDPPGLTFMLKNKWLAFLSSFTYPYLLVLGFVQHYSTETTRTLEYFSFTRLVWTSAADLVSTYILAFFLYVIFHKPVSTILEGEILKKRFKSKTG